MNKAVAVAELVGQHTETYKGNQFSGNNAALARVLGRHPSLITRMTKAGEIPARYNSTLMAWARKAGVTHEMAGLVAQTCPCCGQSLPID